MPTNLDALEQENLGYDGTAEQFDRGYYKDPELVAALVVVPDEEQYAMADEPMMSAE